MHSKIGNRASGYALRFIGIASQINQIKNFEEKENRLNTLVDMIEKDKLDLKKLFYADYHKTVSSYYKKDLFEWDDFLGSLSKEQSPLKNTGAIKAPAPL
ncbi:hypothetical protein [Endozoicomonas ascidiicola]|uniref:hypothetical protein n=1 Tax=Endozoicomonas ascidiicola TaxID=1698521 RepID=UPI00082D3EF2|nr:hypothetical protein [Endozoicomonas ascidiicola]